MEASTSADIDRTLEEPLKPKQPHLESIPLNLLEKCKEKHVTVETTNGSMFRGIYEFYDRTRSRLHLSDVMTSQNKKMFSIVIPGRTITWIQLPDDLSEDALFEEALRDECKMQRARGLGKGRQGYDQGSKRK